MAEGKSNSDLDQRLSDLLQSTNRQWLTKPKRNPSQRSQRAGGSAGDSSGGKCASSKQPNVNPFVLTPEPYRPPQTYKKRMTYLSTPRYGHERIQYGPPLDRLNAIIDKRLGVDPSKTVAAEKEEEA